MFSTGHPGVQIENLWGLLVRKIYKNARQFETTTDLKVEITDS